MEKNLHVIHTTNQILKVSIIKCLAYQMKKLIKHNQLIIRNIDLKVYQYKKLIQDIRRVNYNVKI